MSNFLSLISLETAKIWIILGPLAIIVLMISSGIVLVRFKSLWRSLSEKKPKEDPSGLGIKVVKKYRHIAAILSIALFILAIVNFFAIAGHFTANRALFGDYADFIRSVGISVASLIFMPIVVFIIYSLYKLLYSKIILKRSIGFWLTAITFAFIASIAILIRSRQVL